MIDSRGFGLARQTAARKGGRFVLPEGGAWRRPQPFTRLSGCETWSTCAGCGARQAPNRAGPALRAAAFGAVDFPTRDGRNGRFCHRAATRRCDKGFPTRRISPMQSTFRAAAIALAFFLPLTGVASAQPGKQAPPAKQAPPPAQPQQAPQEDQQAPQIALTDKQVAAFITATPDITKITSKLQAEPDQKTQGQLDGIAKKAGFKDFEEYEIVSANIQMVMLGIDPQTKKFGDPKKMIQGQIDEVNADKKMKPAEKKQALEELNQQIKDVQPIKNQGNIALVEKNFDALIKLMQE
jgi:hypothetical protein